jgi:exodeoxyribonuclease-3
VLQEASKPQVVARIADGCGMRAWGARARHSVAFMSRIGVAHHVWHRPGWSRRAFLEVVLAGSEFRVFGVHLTAIHSNWTERLRARELRSLLASIKRHRHGPHLVAGDFNTLAPGEQLDPKRLPMRLRWLVWLNGGTIRWQTIHMMIDADYADAYRKLHPLDPGATFPTWDPHIRLDYTFVPERDVDKLRSCRIVSDAADAARASDHFPLLTDYAV